MNGMKKRINVGIFIPVRLSSKRFPAKAVYDSSFGKPLEFLIKNPCTNAHIHMLVEHHLDKDGIHALVDAYKKRGMRVLPSFAKQSQQMDHRYISSSNLFRLKR